MSFHGFSETAQQVLHGQRSSRRVRDEVGAAAPNPLRATARRAKSRCTSETTRRSPRPHGRPGDRALSPDVRPESGEPDLPVVPAGRFTKCDSVHQHSHRDKTACPSKTHRPADELDTCRGRATCCSHASTMAPMTAIKPPETATSTTEFSGTGTIRNPATGAVAGEVRWTDPADVPRIAAGLRRRSGSGRRAVRGPRQGAGPLRGVAGRAPRRDRGAADQGDRQVGDRRRPRGAAADHDRVVLHQDDGEGAGAGNPSGGAAVHGDQEGHRALPAASRRRHHRAVELPGRQPAHGRHRRAGRRLRGAAQAVRAHAADRRAAAARLAGLRRTRGDGDGPGRPRGVEAVVDNADYIQFTGSSATGAR